MKEAIILAGGLGTRLSTTVKDKQKVMAPVGGRPFLEYLLKDLKTKGFARIIFAVSYRHEQIKDFFGNSFESMEILYSVEASPLGTGGAIKQALGFCKENAVYVINGDTFFDVDYDALYNIFLRNHAKFALAAKEMPDCTRHSTLEIDENGKILNFTEKKPNKNGYINGGIYVIDRKAFEDFPEDRFSFEKDLLEKEKSSLYALVSKGYFIDMGIPEAYFRANTEIPLLFGNNTFKALFLDRDGVICKEKHHLYKTEDFEFIDRVPEAIEQLREMGYLIIVVTNQAGVAKGLYTEEDIKRLHAYMENALSDITHIDAVYYCPYHEDAVIEKYKKYSPDRKPGDGMIKKAVADFMNKGIFINLKDSIIVGDKLSDIEAGINAGIGKTVLVRSGHPIDEKNTIADIIIDSLIYLPDELRREINE